ncbi:general transcription factor IIH subunit 2-like [Macrosteles quadrilineatus]|uniref:general transcription factor IIH subunit 2-like n=1 Tax=Macrosteles quadrilineatus TaxID=74068 RepID=UPI0023E1BB10|nr:general transcription factor IIH subunit 2-like [Macrosteles quadrilineatus]XP_054286485.1 general transcription factor IIH subunit 2-like [Macrosteles quadrilineatus]
MAEDEDGKEYRWETGYEKTWEALQEDDEGLLEASVADIIQKAKRKRQAERKGHTKLGMMRHLYLIIDSSEAMLDQDLKPTRQLCTNKLLEGFIEEFFDQNPISQLGVISTRNKRADKVSELAGNARKHLSVIQSQFSLPSQCVGEPSLQNALELAASSLKMLPSHASREILIILGSLTTCDPGDITQTIMMLKSQNIRVSVIGLAAEVRICTALCKDTGGVYGVVLDDRHFRDLLFTHVEPPPASVANSQEASLIKMGFPHHDTTDGRTTSLSMCMCHIDSVSDASKLKSGGYCCPQCRSKYCELPTECRVCGLTLVSAPHLARSYHHLFPVTAFRQENATNSSEPHCYACRHKFSDRDKYVYQCETCSRVFCLECDMFIHDTLHTCPGCATNQSTFLQQAR